jgi:hypothetical protein
MYSRGRTRRRQKQKAGGVLIEPANALHAALGQLRRQQVKDAQVVLRIARTLVARRLVQHQIRFLPIPPGHAVEIEFE